MVCAPAQVVKLVDTLASGASGGNPVEVQVLSWAPSDQITNGCQDDYFHLPTERLTDQGRGNNFSKSRKWSRGKSNFSDTSTVHSL